jgi:putative FmdB family regulatory protein
MPTYEYRCKSCGEHLEVVQSFTDEPLTECPSCGGDLRKVFGSIGIAFKGSGFYKTDSRAAASASSSSSSSATSGNGSSADSGTSSTSTSSDSSSSDSSSSSDTGKSSSSGGGSEAKSA